MKKGYLTLLFSLFVVLCYAGNINSNKSGEWDVDDTWDIGRKPVGGDEITIRADQTVYVSRRIDVGGDPVVLHIYGTLYFNQAGQLKLPSGSKVYMYEGGDIVVDDANNPNNSAHLIIGNNHLSGSKLDAVEGPTYLDESNLGDGGEPLPVNLLYFTATPQQKTVKLEWVSSKAWDFSHFELERSADGITFDYLDTIDAEENTNWIVNYSYTDRQPLSGISYYRLKAVDIDGKFEYKGLEVVQLADGAAVNVYPNPSNRGFLHVQQQKAAGARVSLKDNSGRTVYTGTMEPSGKSIDTSALQPGMYVLTVESTTGIQKKHVIIQ